jgi:hypothetical protein
VNLINGLGEDLPENGAICDQQGVTGTAADQPDILDSMLATASCDRQFSLDFLRHITDGLELDAALTVLRNIRNLPSESAILRAKRP